MTLRRVALVGTVAVVSLAAGCSSDARPSVARSSASVGPVATDTSRAPAQRTSACKPVPPPGPALDWLPADLPLPEGSYPIADDQASPSSEADSDAPETTHRGFVAVRGTVDDFKKFVTTTWTASGWTLGKGDAEPGEAEGGYRKGDVGGAYRVRDVYCDPSMSELLLTFGRGATPP